ncbi:MAG: nuclear transport factor 2 family protein [Eubacterium sp.]|nr:nuclear transport factor 2 family protein [Eubacterium sp.]
MGSFSTEELIVRWEDQRQIKNLMGKYANCVILNREAEIFGAFWSKEKDDVYLGFNDGCYRGREVIASYYEAESERTAVVGKILQKKFPEQLGNLSDEELYGVGPFKVRPLACPVIEIAEDGESAKGLWHCQGAYNEVETAGPVSYWTWGYFAVDFVKEGDDWKIWHLLYVNDVDSICGQSWGKPVTPYPDLPEFAELGEFKYPGYTEEKTIREYYSPTRKLTVTPRIPEPYGTFGDTFSYAL